MKDNVFNYLNELNIQGRNRTIADVDENIFSLEKETNIKIKKEFFISNYKNLMLELC